MVGIYSDTSLRFVHNMLACVIQPDILFIVDLSNCLVTFKQDFVELYWTNLKLQTFILRELIKL